MDKEEYNKKIGKCNGKWDRFKVDLSYTLENMHIGWFSCAIVILMLLLFLISRYLADVMVLIDSSLKIMIKVIPKLAIDPIGQFLVAVTGILMGYFMILLMAKLLTTLQVCLDKTFDYDKGDEK